ncbi:glycine--tRNA ligase subunit beta [Magnetovirga frankeli]|uniref:glycine--tRNA ligase subunit beta n=1 Tax=Magnetovirga frankeli TaxID=947516 RepID=UPI00129362C9|nr:glycine--tRNA ligase subunit beta [gamma proteobacterium SS-5]
MSDRADLLFEIGTEELPPKALLRLADALQQGFAQGLEQEQLNYSSIKSFASPRRLALMISQLECRQPDQQIERRGPARTVAFDEHGQPSKALLGFARSCKVDPSQLISIKTDQGEWMGHSYIKPGSLTRDLLPHIAEQALASLPIPKRMRWGNQDFQFLRPVHWLLFLFGNQTVACTLYGVQAAAYTHGHRFHHPQAIELDSPADYEARLQEPGKVIADFSKRRSSIAKQIEQSAQRLGLQVDLDTHLLDEVCALTEWPVAISGSFDAGFLQVPTEALVLTMKQNQKYFPLYNAQHRLANHFITIANIDSPKPELIKEGNERVIRPRLSDAMFFWQQDGRIRLEDRVQRLSQVTFQKDLGSLFDKTLRVQKLAHWLAERTGADIQAVDRAALLSRCDLITEMVYEFPEMQGHMGRYQALRDGEDEEIATALAEFYLPRHAGDDLPKGQIGQCLALADRMDSLCGIFSVGLKPSGDKDPYGLRRASIGIIRILKNYQPLINFRELIQASLNNQPRSQIGDSREVEDYFIERIKAVYLDAGFSLSSIQAVLATCPSSFAEMNAKIQAISEFTQTQAAAELIELNKRINNILRKQDEHDLGQPSADLFQQVEETALFNALQAVHTEIEQAVQEGHFANALGLLLSLKDPVAAFFEAVMVMDENTELRLNRLAMLDQLRLLLLAPADLTCL